MPVRPAAAEQPVAQAPGELATLQAFVNTRDIEQATEELASPETLANWLSGAGLLGPADDHETAGDQETARSRETARSGTGPADLAMAVQLREALRGVLRSHVAAQPGDGAADLDDDAGGLARLDDDVDGLADLRRISAALPIRLEVSAQGGIGLAAAGSGVPAALARILLIAATASTVGAWPRLKACGADDCQWAFYDRSPTRSGCWCSMRVCGSRAKSRAYRRRTAGRG
jgi:predicted RNA-binding Zn ribbon-like protein